MTKAIFWDFDGTLVHSNDLWAKGMYSALQEQTKDSGIEYDEILKRKNDYSYPWDRWEEDYTSMTTTESWWGTMSEVFKNTLMDSGVAPQVAAAATIQVRKFVLSKDLYVVFPDSVPALEMSRKLGYKNYILSNNYPELREIIEALDLTQYFEDIFVSGEIGYEKPRQEIFDYAKEKSGNPEVMFMIGDNPRADAAGGNMAGMITVLIRRVCEHEAQYYLPDLSGLEEILKKY